MKLTVRLDDITPDMDWEKFFAFKELLDEYQIKPLIGVVPDNKDQNLKGESRKDAPKDYWAFLQNLQKEGWVIAQHGYQHIYSTKEGGLFPLNDFSEFAGKPYEEQLRTITKGRNILEAYGIHTDLFMAPAHSYDSNTLKALKESGFTGITDGFGYRPYDYRGMTFYPISFLLMRTMQRAKGYSTMVVHTATVRDLAVYRSYFQNSQIEWVPYSEYLTVPHKKQSAFAHAREHFMAYCKGMLGRKGIKA